jgi:hypothetical protein
MNEFFGRLKQRKLVQWAIAYVAAAFGLLQGIDIIASRFGWPDAIQRTLIIAFCTGFFVVLVLAWYHGERGAQRATGTELLIIVMLLACGGVFVWRFAPASDRSGNKAGAIPNDSSIAVLPFLDMSQTRDQGYFSDGISEELLNLLAKIPQLKVAARTSSFSFKDKGLDIPEIARQLGVANVLEGSVRKSGDQ